MREQTLFPGFEQYEWNFKTAEETDEEISRTGKAGRSSAVGKKRENKSASEASPASAASRAESLFPGYAISLEWFMLKRFLRAYKRQTNG